MSTPNLALSATRHSRGQTSLLGRHAAAIAIAALLWPAAAAGFDEVDLRAYQPATLQSVFAAAPASPGAFVELAAADVQARVEAVYTGNRREPSGVLLRPLMTAWTQSQGLKESLADLRQFPEMEFADGGRRYWMIAFYPAVLRASDAKPGQRFGLFLRRIGFTAGQPVVLIDLMASPEQVAAELAKPPRPATPPPPRPQAPVLRGVDAYGSGQLRASYAGKTYTLPGATVKEPVTGRLLRTAGSLATKAHPQFGVYHELLVDFGDTRSDGVVMSLLLPGPGTHTNYADFKVNLRLGETMTTLLSSHFSACTATVGQLDAAGARGKLACTGAASGSQAIGLDFVVSR